MHPIYLTRAEAESILLERFQIPHFYDEQWDAIQRLLNGERILMIQRTGFGKSLCYQFPAILFPGVTIVFSPLIALMRDQVHALEKKGIASGFINSEQTFVEKAEVIRRAIEGEIKILYIAPERQENEEWLQAVSLMDLSMVVIDEAHTISTWGHDFRPAFKKIIDLVRRMPLDFPVLATTATANRLVQHDIEKQIEGNITTIRGSLVRENFNLFVVRVKSNDEKMIWLAKNIPNLTGTGIIYSGTRVEAEFLSKWLQFCNIDAVEYHAGLEGEVRQEIEKGLMSNQWKCVVSTNALGMGIDKPDIRFIIHTQIPQSPIHYYQEIGRGGRDGLSIQIVLLFNESIVPSDSGYIYKDLKLPTAFIENARPSKDKYLRVIEILKEEPLGEKELTLRSNLKLNQIRIIKADLLSQGIISIVADGKMKRMEYKFNAPELDVSEFERVREERLKDLEKIVEYVYTVQPRMKFLCSFLDSQEEYNFKNCDNTSLPKQILTAKDIDESLPSIDKFRLTFFPVLDVSETSTKSYTDDNGDKVTLSLRLRDRDQLEIRRNNVLIGIGSSLSDFYFGTDEEERAAEVLYNRHLTSKSRLLDGIAGAYYGDSIIGKILHRCKYENGGAFPDLLVRQTLQAFNK